MICWCLWCSILYSRAPLPKANRAEFVYQHVHALDMETYNILTKLPECLEFIKLGRSEGAILVHWLVSYSDYGRRLLSHSWLSSFVFLSTFHWLLIKLVIIQLRRAVEKRDGGAGLPHANYGYDVARRSTHAHVSETYCTVSEAAALYAQLRVCGKCLHFL